MKKIVFLIAIFTGIIAFGQQEHSGGIPLTTGFKLEDPQPIDDKYVVADSASLISLPNVYEGLWSYSKADSAIFVYDGSKWNRIAKGDDLSTLNLEEILKNGNTTTLPIWFPYNENSKGFKWSIYSSPSNNPNLKKGGQYVAKIENDGYLSLYNNLLDRNGLVSTNTYFGFQSIFSLKKDSIDNTHPTIRGRNNTAFGYQPLKYMTSGYGNTAFGFAPLRDMITGADNTALGEGAAGYATHVDESLILGATAALNSSHLQNAIVIGRGAAQETDTIINSTLIGNFQHDVELSENEIIIADGTIGSSSGIGFQVTKEGRTTLNRQTQNEYDLDSTGKAAVTKEILNNQLDDFGEDYIPQSEKGANNGVATLDGGGKIPAAQLPNSVMTLEGEWNASTNTPTLTDGTGNAGMIYEVTTAGTVDLGSGSITFAVGDYAVYGSSGVWYKSINSNEVTSVNGQTGVVNLGINSLSDTPANFTGAGGKFMVVNSGATAMEYRTIVPTDLGTTTNGYIPYRVDGTTFGQYAVVNNTATPNSIAQRTGAGGRLKMGSPTSFDDGVTLGYANSNFQPLDGDLTSIAGLSGTSGLLRKTAANTWSLDTNTYLTEVPNDAVTNAKLANMAEGTIKGRVASGTGDPQDLTLDAVIKAMGLAIPVIYDLEDFTLPAMSSPPAQNSFSPITILSSTEIPDNMIDWEITWTDSGIHYKLSSIGDYNVELRESGGDIQISGQTRSQSSIAVDDATNEPKIIFYVKPE